MEIMEDYTVRLKFPLIHWVYSSAIYYVKQKDLGHYTALFKAYLLNDKLPESLGSIVSGPVIQNNNFSRL